MEKKNIIPQANKPVVRVTQGTQTNLLTDLSEEVLAGTMGVTPNGVAIVGEMWSCSMDDDAE
ncbi:MAG: microcyclamide/patellamide family RiPP [Symploca sp. SIO2G7]|nr:microcyclamide/patellamide family RiPP [Symploca sp. SIO2G7]